MIREIPIVFFALVIFSVYGCQDDTENCLLYPLGCHDTYDMICCTRNWNTECCCKTTHGSVTLVMSTFTNSYSLFSSIDGLTTAITNRLSQATGTTAMVHLSINMLDVNRSVSVNMTSQAFNFQVASGRAETKGKVSMTLVIVVSGITTVVVLLLICLFGYCIMYNDVIRLALYRWIRTRFYIHRSPPPSMMDLI